MNLWLGTEGDGPVRCSAWLGIVGLAFLALQLFQERLGFCWWCGAVERKAHAVMACGLKFGERRLVTLLCRIHRLLLIRWLRGLILALKILYSLRQIRNRLLNFVVVHKFETDALWLTMPNDLSSATAATRRADCNHDGPPPFAAAHG